MYPLAWLWRHTHRTLLPEVVLIYVYVLVRCIIWTNILWFPVDPFSCFFLSLESSPNMLVYYCVLHFLSPSELASLWVLRAFMGVPNDLLPASFSIRYGGSKGSPSLLLPDLMLIAASLMSLPLCLNKRISAELSFGLKRRHFYLHLQPCWSIRQ